MVLLALSEREEEGFVSYDDVGASVDTSMTDNRNMLGFTKATATTDAPTQHCHTPPAKEANQYAQKRSKVVAISDLTPTRNSNRILKKMASAQNNVPSQRKEAPFAAALTGKSKLQSLGRKNVAFGKRSEERELDTTCLPEPATATATSPAKKKAVKRKKKFGAPDKKVPMAELEIRYTTTGTKVNANFSDDSDNEDHVANDDSN